MRSSWASRTAGSSASAGWPPTASTAADAERHGINAGDRVRVTSARGSVEGPARITEIREGVVFVPVHYGWWDQPDGPSRAANELTLSAVDPSSKQPLVKVGAVSISSPRTPGPAADTSR